MSGGQDGGSRWRWWNWRERGRFYFKSVGGQENKALRHVPAFRSNPQDIKGIIDLVEIRVKTHAPTSLNVSISGRVRVLSAAKE